jgi:hypothetical protein
MPDQQSNPEPMEEKDLNRKEDFLAGNENQPEMKTEASEIEKEKMSQPEQTSEPEQSLERKEGAAEKEDAYAKILSSASASQKPATEEEISRDAEIAMREKDAESKINNLVNIAETKGVAHAVKVARHMQDNYILDEFHDKLLTDELHEFLVKKGLIKEI